MVLRERPRATHEVTNQPPPVAPYDAFTADLALVEAVRREGAGWASEELSALGRFVGSPEAVESGRLANANPPVLHTHDRYGNRADVVEYHPAYHDFMRESVGRGIHAGPWSEPRGGAHVARGAKLYLMSQAEPGHICPVSMTYSAVPALRVQPDLAAEWEPRLASTDYDPRFLPAAHKSGALCGMAMTEKQGGSDVRANTTTAESLGGDEYLVTGHKWFCSAPMCDAFLVLAQAPGGLTCFLLPRFTPAGDLNAFQVQRLKDKLGNRSNASGEVEFDGAWARLVGEEGRGVRTIIEMVNHTRLDCVLGSASGMRHGVVQAVHHARHRHAFGSALADHALMRNVLADLAVESEAATVTAMRLARAYDSSDEGERAFRRLATAVAKYWICKRGPAHAVECLECLGGNGYVEDSGMPLLFRESPVNSVWEGSGNVICLDVLRAMSRQPESAEAFFDELDAVRGADRRLDRHLDDVQAELGSDIDTIEGRARRLVEKMALALQGCLVVRHSPPAVADAFCASRLEADGGLAFGTLPGGVRLREIVDRVLGG